MIFIWTLRNTERVVRLLCERRRLMLERPETDTERVNHAARASHARSALSSQSLYVLGIWVTWNRGISTECAISITCTINRDLIQTRGNNCWINGDYSWTQKTINLSWTELHAFYIFSRHCPLGILNYYGVWIVWGPAKCISYLIYGIKRNIIQLFCTGKWRNWWKTTLQNKKTSYFEICCIQIWIKVILFGQFSKFFGYFMHSFSILLFSIPSIQGVL